METPKLDEEIGRLQWLVKIIDLSDCGKEKLTEFIAIKKVLNIQNVSQQSELVCDHNLMPKQPSDATDYCVCTKCGQYVKQTCC